MTRPIAALVLTLALASVAGPRHHDVQLAFRGYTGLAESADCLALVDTAGYDSLSGTLTGAEDPAQPDEDVVYTGVLRRTTRLDYCMTKPGKSTDQVVWCAARLIAAARMTVELTVYGEDGNGAYLKAVPAGPPDSVRVTGTCLQADMNAILADYPKGESGGTPDGQPIAEPGNLPLKARGARALRLGYFPPNRPITTWGLRVVRESP